MLPAAEPLEILSVTVEPEHAVELPTAVIEATKAAGSVIVTEVVAVVPQVLSVTVTL